MTREQYRNTFFIECKKKLSNRSYFVIIEIFHWFIK